MDKTSWQAWVQIAEAQQTKEMFEESVRSYQKAKEIDPENGDIASGLQRVSMVMGVGG